jgi:hypothetical protein
LTFVYAGLEFLLPDDWTGNVVESGSLALLGPREERRMEECAVQLSGHDFGGPVTQAGLRAIMHRQGFSDGIREVEIGPLIGVATETSKAGVRYLMLNLGARTTAIFVVFSAPAAFFDRHKGTLWSVLSSARFADNSGTVPEATGKPASWFRRLLGR